MGKATRSKLRSRNVETPLNQRKFAVKEKEVEEKIVYQEGDISVIPAKPVDLVTKDVKKKQRHEAWLEKLDRSYALKKKQQKKEIKRQNNLGIDLSNIGEVLDTIKFKPKTNKKDVNMEEEKKEPAIPTNKIKSKKAKKQAELQEILRMQKVMQTGAFKENPLGTIRQHVQNTFT
ncbi:hypothetical protein CU097_009177 [Rhizopus azygosporus]|uniref:Ribosome biogenesis protein SLX9 n=2 Tax=Rhizopus TaxID=4842 RepID=A0A367JAI3_RHIAZ|nr:hypothetical protein BCV71DRAFT_205835 [Rhizopus microsporus]RCH86905.1 hypothetical protein CU097_009177 [Rhizopus azygosporus]CEG77162.1 hypothetical protein RMATCC62417_11959 [Rhizopus microsporus]CEI99834.1 hypothetical protein RMCBS344292_13914 [Rhizopus microsporus]